MRNIVSILLLSLLSYYGYSMERDTIPSQSKSNDTFNWGVKVGFNSTLPVINNLVIDDVEIENTRVEYKVGYMAALILRVNFDRFFIQPSLSIHNTESEIYFSLPSEQENAGEAQIRNLTNQLNLRIHSLELPVLIGYNLVKEGPFGLSVMVGPKLKYNYQIRYKTNLDNYQDIYTSDDTAYRVNLVGGIGVALWRLSFDFTYEVGINHRETNFRQVNGAQPLSENIVVDKRLNMMGFSLGLFF